MLRDQMLADLKTVVGHDDLSVWAQHNLPTKNTLIIDDAIMVEQAFEVALAKVPDDKQLDAVEDIQSIHLTRDTNAASAQTVEAQIMSGRAQRIPITAAPIVKPIRRRNKKHRVFVASQPCLVCGRTPSDAHHVKFAQPRALGLKVSDEFTVPLCRIHHHELHLVGDEQKWWEDRKLDPLPIALELWKQSNGPFRTNRLPPD